MCIEIMYANVKQYGGGGEWWWTERKWARRVRWIASEGGQMVGRYRFDAFASTTTTMHRIPFYRVCKIIIVTFYYLFRYFANLRSRHPHDLSKFFCMQRKCNLDEMNISNVRNICLVYYKYVCGRLWAPQCVFVLYVWLCLCFIYRFYVYFAYFFFGVRKYSSSFYHFSWLKFCQRRQRPTVPKTRLIAFCCKFTSLIYFSILWYDIVLHIYKIVT